MERFSSAKGNKMQSQGPADLSNSKNFGTYEGDGGFQNTLQGTMSRWQP
jgi:hypothetical protein